MTTSHPIWILVASSAEAALYSCSNLRAPQLTLIEKFQHKESAMKKHELSTDRPGRVAYAAYDESDPKAAEVEKFAIELADRLRTGCHQKHCQEIMLVAPSHFYGLLNKHLGNHAPVSHHLNKDYTQSTEEELISHIKAYARGE